MSNENITLMPSAEGHAFTRNPLMLNMPGTGKRVFTVYGQEYTNTKPAYKGEVTAPARINLSEFIEAIVPPIEDPGETNAMISYGLQDGSITITVTDGENSLFSQTIIAHQGGVSKQNYRKLIQAGTDIFAARFLNPACNFFLTTRTHDWRLNIKETELYPLVFFYPSQGTLAVQDIVNSNKVSLPAVSNDVDYHGKLCALNLKAIRQYFLKEYNCITGILDVLVDETPAARIAIQESRPQRERYRLKFRNSFGAFEIVELTGNAQCAPEVNGEQEYQQYKRYLADIDDFAAERQRAEISIVIKLSTGYKTRQELEFILDAIASEEIFLLDVVSDPVKVIVTSEELTYDLHPNGPQAFSLKITPVDDDTCITGELPTEAMSIRGGLFSQEFSEEFD